MTWATHGSVTCVFENPDSNLPMFAGIQPRPSFCRTPVRWFELLMGWWIGQSIPFGWMSKTWAPSLERSPSPMFLETWLCLLMSSDELTKMSNGSSSHAKLGEFCILFRVGFFPLGVLFPFIVPVVFLFCFNEILSLPKKKLLLCGFLYLSNSLYPTTLTHYNDISKQLNYIKWLLLYLYIWFLITIVDYRYSFYS